MKTSSSMTSLLGAHQDSEEMKVTVFGSGSFGMAMATLVARNGFDVVVLTRREEVATGINTEHRNPVHLKEYKLPENLKATTDAKEALKNTSFIVHCIPLQSTKPFLEGLKDVIEPDVPIVSTSKGLHTETLDMMHEIIPSALGRPQPVAFLSGPTFAQDIMMNTPSGAVSPFYSFLLLFSLFFSHLTHERTDALFSIVFCFRFFLGVFELPMMTGFSERGHLDEQEARSPLQRSHNASVS